MESLKIIDDEENISTDISKIGELEKKVELLESKITKLETIIHESSNKPKNSKSDPVTVMADVQAYKKSLVLTSESKETGTYQIKDILKQNGAKWFTKILEGDKKISGWILVGVLNDKNVESATKELSDKLKEQNINLVAEIKTEIN